MKKGLSILSGALIFALAIVAAPFFVGLYLQAELPKVESLIKDYPQFQIVGYHRRYFSSDAIIKFRNHLFQAHIEHGPIIFDHFSHMRGPILALALAKAEIKTPTMHAQGESLLHFDQTLSSIGTLFHLSMKEYDANIEINNGVAQLHSNLNSNKTTGTVNIAATATLDNQQQQIQAAFYKNLTTGQENLKLTVAKTALESWLAQKTKHPDALINTLEKIKYLQLNKDQHSYTLDINLQNGKVNS